MKLILWLCFIIVIVGSSSAQDDCQGFESRLAVGDTGVVSPGAANNVRDQPDPAADLVGKLEAGTRFRVLNGPICAGGYVWWQVETTDWSLSGYTVEGVNGDYWLEPFETPAVHIAITPQDVSLDFTAFANTIFVELVEEAAVGDYFWYGAPEHIHVYFPDLYYSEYITPFVILYPVEYFQYDYPDTYESIIDYITALNSPALADPDSQWMPFLPMINAAMIHRSHAKYIEGSGFRGYRFITQFSQYPAAIRSSELFYSFQGVTDDGNTYITAALPLWNPLQDSFVDQLDAEESIFDNVGVKQEYAAPISEHAASLPDDTFIPTLATLDQAILSLHLDGSGTMPPPVTDRFASQPVFKPETLNGNFFFSYYPGDDEVFFGEFADGDVVIGGLEMMSLRYLARHFFYEGLIEMKAILDEQPAELDHLPNPIGTLEEWDSFHSVRYITTDSVRGVRLVAIEVRNSEEQPRYLFRGITTEGHIFMLSHRMDANNGDLSALDRMIEAMVFEIPQ